MQWAEAEFTNCVFTGNMATAGGGIYVTGTSVLTNCTVANNSADEQGGGTYRHAIGDSTLVS
jgi:predicted outer membrane repeat protein